MMTANRKTNFLAITVGEISPFPSLPTDELAVAMTLRHAVPVVIVSLPDVRDEDIANIKSPPQAVALYQSPAIPAGALLLVLKVSETEVWTMCAPFLDDESAMRAWAAQETDSNSLLVVLVDAGTRIVRAQRTIGLPPRLLEMVRVGIRQAPEIDQDAAVAQLNEMSDTDVWAEATRWQDVDDSGFFTMVKEGTARA